MVIMTIERSPHTRRAEDQATQPSRAPVGDYSSANSSNATISQLRASRRTRAAALVRAQRRKCGATFC